MENKKRKSILQTQSSKEEDITGDVRSKRVSFSGKKFVREFKLSEQNYEFYDRSIETSSNSSGNKTNPQPHNTESSSLLCTTNEYIDKSNLEFLKLESTACISLTEKEIFLLETNRNRLQLRTENQLSKLALETETNKPKPTGEPQKTQPNFESDGTKLIFFNENSNKENISPQNEMLPVIGSSKTKTFEDTLTVFNETLKNKALLSDSDESFETRSFRQDLQRINEHVTATNANAVCEPDVVKGAEMQTNHKNIIPTIEAHPIRSTAKSPKVVVRHITTPMKLMKSVQEQNLSKKMQQQQQTDYQQHQAPQEQQQFDLHKNDDPLSLNISGISRISDSFGSFSIQSANESSPLLPLEYRANYKEKIDLQQLNADVASGKVKLFSKTGNFNRKIATPLNFKKTQTKDAMVIELENSFWGNSNKNEKETKTFATKTPNNFEATKHVVHNMDLEEESSQENAPAENAHTTKHVVDIDMETTLVHANDFVTEVPVNEKISNTSKRQTILFQDAIIDEEVNVQQHEIGASKGVYVLNECEMEEVTRAECIHRQPAADSARTENYIPKKLEDLTTLDMSLQMQKTMHFDNAGIIETNTCEQIPSSLAENVKVIKNGEGGARRGTILFQSEEIELETSGEKSRTVNRILFKDSQDSETNDDNNEKSERETLILPKGLNSRRETCHLDESISEEMILNRCLPEHTNGELPFIKSVQEKDFQKSAISNADRRETYHVNESISEEIPATLTEPKFTGAIPKLQSQRNTHAPRIERIEKQSGALKENIRQTCYVNESISEELQMGNAETKSADVISKPEHFNDQSAGLKNKRRVTCHINESISEELQMKEPDTNHTAAISSKPPFTRNTQVNSIEDLNVNNADLKHKRRVTCHMNESISEEIDLQTLESKQTNVKPKLPFLLNTTHQMSIKQLEDESAAFKHNRRETCYINESISEEIQLGTNVDIVPKPKNANAIPTEELANENVASKDKRRVTCHMNEIISEELQMEKPGTNHTAAISKPLFTVNTQENYIQNAGLKVKRRVTCHINESISEETDLQNFEIKQTSVKPKLPFLLNTNEMKIEQMEVENAAFKDNRRETCYINESISEEIKLSTNADLVPPKPRNSHALPTEQLANENAASKDKRHETCHMNESILEEIETKKLKTKYTGAIPKLKYLGNQQKITLEHMEIQNVQSNDENQKSVAMHQQAFVNNSLAHPTNDISFVAQINKTKSNEAEPMEVDDCHFKIPSNQPLMSSNIINKKTPKKSRKTVCFSETIDEDLMTPRRVTTFGILQCSKYVATPATPHRSLLEFENLEEEVKSAEESILGTDTPTSVEKVKNAASFATAADAASRKSLKRDTTNMTPILSVSKKRQSLHLDFFTNISQIRNFTAKQLHDESCNNTGTDDVIDRTEPPSGFYENVSEIEMNEKSAGACKMNTPASSHKLKTSMQLTGTTPSRIPVYLGVTANKPPRRVSSPNLQSLVQLDMDTIDEIRFVTTVGSADDTEKPGAFENDDDVPITISDVSQHYLSLKEKHCQKIQTLVKDTCSLIVDENINSKSTRKSVSDEIKEGLAECRELLNMTYDPEKMQELALRQYEEIDGKQDEFEDDPELQGLFDFSAKEAIAKIEAEHEEMSRKECFEQKALVCRKCARCQESIINETITTLEAAEASDSFERPIIPPLSSLRLMDSLEKCKRPRFEDTIKLFEQIKLERLKNSLEASVVTIDSDSEDEAEDEDYGNSVIKQYYEWKKREDEMLAKLKQMSQAELLLSFVDKLEHLLKQPAAKNWSYNLGWQAVKILKFRHKILVGFLIVLQYKEVTTFGTEVKIKSIKLHEKTIDDMPLNTLSYMKLFQLKLEIFSEDLLRFCEGDTAEDVMQMLHKINEICIDIHELSYDLLQIVWENKAGLVRENNRNFIVKNARKVVYEDGNYHHTDTTEFRIEVTNIRKLCYKNIITPPLFMLNEDIAALPVGVSFLKHFLKDPLSHLKNNNENA